MKRLTVVFLGAIFSLALFFGIAQAADKLGYVDLGRAFSEYSKAKTSEKTFNDKLKVYTDEHDKKVAELKTLQDKISLLNDKEREAKGADFQSKLKAFQDYDRQKQMDLRKEQDVREREIVKDIEEAVNKYSEKEGYTLVFSGQFLVYKAKSMDITNQIIAILNSPSK